MAFTNKITVADLTATTAAGKFVKSGANYFGNITGSRDKPHLHISGTTSALHEQVTISNFSYTTATGINNETLAFTATAGYALIRNAIGNRTQWNALVAYVNSKLIRT